MNESRTGDGTPIVRTMTGQIASRIREHILAGAYAPGSQLLQDSIATQFGVSKIPVREALVQLKAEGLVNIYAHRGFRVRPLSRAEAEEVFTLRLAIEPDAVGRGAILATEQDHHTAQEALTRLNAAIAQHDLTRSGDLNCEFHLALIVPKHQPVTNEVLYRLHTVSQRYVRLHLKPRGRSTRANQEHTALYRAWATGNAQEAKSAVYTHIEKTRDEVVAAL
jgi:DNA-binding GntR family transcriptional regulator